MGLIFIRIKTFVFKMDFDFNSWGLKNVFYFVLQVFAKICFHTFTVFTEGESAIGFFEAGIERLA